MDEQAVVRFKVVVEEGVAHGDLSAGIKLCEGVASGTVEIAGCALSGTGTYSILAFDGVNGTLTGAYRLGLDCCRVYLPVIHRTH